MTAYIVRRLLYAIPILTGVNLLTFFLFFFVNTPDDMARAHLGVRRVTVEQIDKWKQERDYHLPYFHNTGWRQVAVRQVSGAAASLELTAQRSGDLRVRVEVPNPASGTLQVMATADSTASLSWDEEGIEVGLDEERHDLALKLQSRGDSAVHDLSLVLTPSEGAPRRLSESTIKRIWG